MAAELDPASATKATDEPGKLRFRDIPPADDERDRKILEREQQRDQLQEADRRKSLFSKLIDQCGRRYAECSFDSFTTGNAKQCQVLAMVREYAETLPERIKSGEGMVLFGPVGTGKDHLAISIGIEAVKRHGMEAAHVNGQDWFGRVRDSMDEERGPSEVKLIEQLVRPHLLILSDPLPPFGSVGQHMAMMAYRLVRRRYDNLRPTIVTLNVANEQEAEERLGVPTWDRLRQDAWMVFCNWASYRKPARSLGGK